MCLPCLPLNCLRGSFQQRSKFRSRFSAYLQLPEVSLPPQRSQDESPGNRIRTGFLAGSSGLLDLPPTNFLHPVMIISLPCDFLRIWIISKGRDMRIGNHYGFQVKSTIPKIAVYNELVHSPRGINTYRIASALSSCGAVHPKISPGDSGLLRGITTSYFPPCGQSQLPLEFEHSC